MTVVDNVVVRMWAEGTGKTAAELEGVDKAVGGVGRTAKAAAGIAGLGALAFGLKDIVQGAMSFQQQTNQIANALHQTGQFSHARMTQITEFADTLSTHGGYDPASTLEGVQKLIRAHDSVAQAIKDETLATDIARSGQTSYTTAVRTVSIVEQGRVTNLSRMGIVVQAVNEAEDKLRATHQKQVDIVKELEAQGVKFTATQKLQYEETHRLTPEMLAQAKAQDTQATKTAVLTLLWHRFGGATKSFSDSAAGAVSNFEHSVGILGQRLGNVLLPAISDLADGLTAVVGAVGDFATFLQHHKAMVESFAIAVGILGLAWAILNGEIIATAIGFGILAPLMAVVDALMSPWLLALAAIAAIVYLVITHFKDLKTAVIDAFHWVVHAAQDAWGWIKDHWPLLASILFGPIGFAAQYIIRHWGDVKQVFVDVWDWIQGAWQTLEHVVSAPFVAAAHFITGVWAGIKQGAEDVLNWMIDRVNNLIDVLNVLPFVDIGHVGHVGGHPAGPPVQHAHSGMVEADQWSRQWTHPAHPGRATGGPVYSSGVYEVGEQGRELVYIPGGSYVHPDGHPASHPEREWQMKAPILNVLQIGGREFYRGMNESTATVAATR